MLGDHDVVVIEIPASLDAEALVDGLPGSIPATKLRSGSLATAISVTVEVLSATSGVIQIFVAREELAAFGHRLMRRVRDHSELAGAAVTLESGMKTTSLDPAAQDSGEQFAQAVEELSSPGPPEAQP